MILRCLLVGLGAVSLAGFVICLWAAWTLIRLGDQDAAMACSHLASGCALCIGGAVFAALTCEG